MTKEEIDELAGHRAIPAWVYHLIAKVIARLEEKQNE